MDASCESASEAVGVEWTLLMPCLNEARTLPACIGKAKGALERLGLILPGQLFVTLCSVVA